MGMALRIENGGPAERLVRDTGALLSLPEVCLRLRELLADPSHSRRQVADVILHDPALSARLMRIVNSAFYGLAAPVRDISQALGIIGEHELNNLAVVTAIVRNLNALRAGFDLKRFWKLSLFTGTVARNLHLYSPDSRKEELFLAGMLLDVGQLLLYAREPGLEETVRAHAVHEGIAMHAAERRLLGLDHAEVGAALARAWQFSPILRDAIANHHRPPADREAVHMGDILHLASWCAGQVDLERGASTEDEFLHLEPPAALMACLRIDSRELCYVLALSKEGYRQAYEAFCGDHA